MTPDFTIAKIVLRRKAVHAMCRVVWTARETKFVVLFLGFPQLRQAAGLQLPLVFPSPSTQVQSELEVKPRRFFVLVLDIRRQQCQVRRTRVVSDFALLRYRFLVNFTLPVFLSSLTILGISPGESASNIPVLSLFAKFSRNFLPQNEETVTQRRQIEM